MLNTHQPTMPPHSPLESRLRREIAGDVLFDEMSRGLYSTDASIYQIPPVGVVLPKTVADVRAAVEIAAEFGSPILPRGGGTSLSGQTVAAAVVIDFSKYMNRILDIDPERGLVRVEPGVVLDQLNAALKPHGRQFGPDVSTSSRAALGGMIGNNSAGSRSVRHGKTIDHVRELQVLLADGSEITCRPIDAAALSELQSRQTSEGEIYRRLPQIVDANRAEIIARYPRVLRRVSGYNLDAFVPELQPDLPIAPTAAELNAHWPDRGDFNLAKIFVGAEGTLGTITEALLHAIPLPAHRGVACLQYATIDAALRSVPTILESAPSAIEMLDKYIVELSRTNLEYRRYLDFVEGAPEALLIVEYSSDDLTEVENKLRELEQTLAGWDGLEKIIPATDPAMRDRIWNCRKASAPLLLSIPGARKPIAFVEDPAVAPQHAADFARRFREILDSRGIAGSFYGHASVGCLHIRPMLDTKAAQDLELLKAVSDDVAALIAEFHGSMSGEHGDGLARSYHNRQLFGPQLYAAFIEVKQLFDPRGLMNPGKIVSDISPIENLRYGAAYRGTPIQTHLDFSREAEIAEAPGQGFLAAAEMCNGSGVCRKTNTGTMCPSFMATRNEEYSTRGRANALRLALSGQLPEGALTSERMYEVMELCLLCKGCKAECPSNVDVAKLKVEFLAHYYEEHRPSFGTRMMANTARLNRLGSAFAPISNWVARLPGAGFIMEKLLGVDRRRSLPVFARNHFGKWFRGHKPHQNAGRRGKVILLDDCLTSYCEPQINQAAVKLLEQAGYEVQLAGLRCCGRPFFSKGLIVQAKSLIESNIAHLDSVSADDVPILGCEPSCLLSLVDEYPDLVPGEATERVRNRSRLLDAWLAEQQAAGKTDLSFHDAPQTALLHGHCQQKALVGTSGTKAALEMIPNFEVSEVDSGCCGMAGSFGYEHYDVSQQIGERALFPAARSHSNGPMIAPGFSCRHQLAEAAGQTPLHPIELLAAQLTENDE